MSSSISLPSHVKFRREADFGLVYEHENYGYDDASLLTVDETVIDVLEAVEHETPTRAELERQFSEDTIDAIIQRGLLTDAA
jgi:putative mycofactocin binding protein MftB